MLIAVTSICGAPGVSSWSLLLPTAWPKQDLRRRVLVEMDSSGGVLGARYGLGTTPGIVELVSGVRQNVALPEVLGRSGHQLNDQLWVVPSPPSADAAWPVLARTGNLGSVLSNSDDVWFADCGRWWPTAPTTSVVSSADLNLIIVPADDAALLSVRSRVHYFQQSGYTAVIVVGSTPRSIEELQVNFEAPAVKIPYFENLALLAGQATMGGRSRRSKGWRKALQLSDMVARLAVEVAEHRQSALKAISPASPPPMQSQPSKPSVKSTAPPPMPPAQLAIDRQREGETPLPLQQSAPTGMSVPEASSSPRRQGSLSALPEVPSAVVQQGYSEPRPSDRSQPIVGHSHVQSSQPLDAEDFSVSRHSSQPNQSENNEHWGTAQPTDSLPVVDFHPPEVPGAPSAELWPSVAIGDFAPPEGTAGEAPEESLTSVSEESEVPGTNTSGRPTNEVATSPVSTETSATSGSLPPLNVVAPGLVPPSGFGPSGSPDVTSPAAASPTVPNRKAVPSTNDNGLPSEESGRPLAQEIIAALITQPVGIDPSFAASEDPTLVNERDDATQVSERGPAPPQRKVEDR